MPPYFVLLSTSQHSSKLIGQTHAQCYINYAVWDWTGNRPTAGRYAAVFNKPPVYNTVTCNEIVQDIKYGNNSRMSALFWILFP